MGDRLEALKGVHTTLIDSKTGYAEALADAEGKGLAPLFGAMIDMRERHHGEIDAILRASGATPDEQGSFLSVVHRSIFKIRSIFGGLDESVLPGLIDGEQRIARLYEEALDSEQSADAAVVLRRQLDELRGKIAEMQTMRDRADASSAARS